MVCVELKDIVEQGRSNYLIAQDAIYNLSFDIIESYIELLKNPLVAVSTNGCKESFNSVMSRSSDDDHIVLDLFYKDEHLTNNFMYNMTSNMEEHGVELVGQSLREICFRGATPQYEIVELIEKFLDKKKSVKYGCFKLTVSGKNIKCYYHDKNLMQGTKLHKSDKNIVHNLQGIFWSTIRID